MNVPELRFDAGLPGFPGAHRFVLVALDAEPFALLRSLDVSGLEFVVAPAAALFGDYAPVVDDDMAERLGVATADDALVLLILTVDAAEARVTANLAGPVVVNRATGQAAQVVLVGDEYDLRAPVPLSAAAPPSPSAPSA